MFLGVPGLKQSAVAMLLLVAASSMLVSCGNNYNYNLSSGPPLADPTKIKLHVFVSNPLYPNSSSTTPVLNVVDGQIDLISPGVISVAATSPLPGMMVLFPNKRFTMVFSPTNNTLTVVNNASQAVAQNSRGQSASITLPGFSESIVVAPDNVTGYAAVPTVAVTGQAPGVVSVLNLSTDSITAAIPVAGARFLAQSHNGNRILVLGSRSDTVTVLAPSAVGTSTDPRTDVQSSLFDHPVWAAFSSDDSTAYILSCGAGVWRYDGKHHRPGYEQQYPRPDDPCRCWYHRPVIGQHSLRSRHEARGRHLRRFHTCNAGHHLRRGFRRRSGRPDRDRNRDNHGRLP